MSDTQTKLTVLVVDDDHDARESFVEVLVDEGYEVIQARDGREAEECLKQRPAPAAIVLDLMMPKLDGWALASLMRQGRLPNVPLVVVTAAGDRWGYPAPRNRVLKKPVSPAELLAAVDEIAKSGDRPAA